MFRKIINKLSLIVTMLTMLVGAGTGDLRSDEVMKDFEIGIFNKSDVSFAPVATIHTRLPIPPNDNRTWTKLCTEVAKILGIKKTLESAGLTLYKRSDDRVLLRMVDSVKVLPCDQKDKKLFLLPFNLGSIVFPESVLNNLIPIKKRYIDNKFMLSDVLGEINHKWPERFDRKKNLVHMPYVMMKTKSGQQSPLKFMEFVESLPCDMTIIEAIAEFIDKEVFKEYEETARKDLLKKVVLKMKQRFNSICNDYFKKSDSSSSNQPPATLKATGKVVIVGLGAISLAPQDNLNESRDHESNPSSLDRPPGNWLLDDDTKDVAVTLGKQKQRKAQKVRVMSIQTKRKGVGIGATRKNKHDQREKSLTMRAQPDKTRPPKIEQKNLENPDKIRRKKLRRRKMEEDQSTQSHEIVNSRKRKHDEESEENSGRGRLEGSEGNRGTGEKDLGSTATKMRRGEVEQPDKGKRGRKRGTAEKDLGGTTTRKRDEVEKERNEVRSGRGNAEQHLGPIGTTMMKRTEREGWSEENSSRGRPERSDSKRRRLEGSEGRETEREREKQKATSSRTVEAKLPATSTKIRLVPAKIRLVPASLVPQDSDEIGHDADDTESGYDSEVIGPRLLRIWSGSRKTDSSRSHSGMEESNLKGWRRRRTTSSESEDGTRQRRTASRKRSDDEETNGERRLERREQQTRQRRTTSRTNRDDDGTRRRRTSSRRHDDEQTRRSREGDERSEEQRAKRRTSSKSEDETRRSREGDERREEQTRQRRTTSRRNSDAEERQSIIIIDDQDSPNKIARALDISHGWYPYVSGTDSSCIPRAEAVAGAAFEAEGQYSQEEVEISQVYPETANATGETVETAQEDSTVYYI